MAGHSSPATQLAIAVIAAKARAPRQVGSANGGSAVIDVYRSDVNFRLSRRARPKGVPEGEFFHEVRPTRTHRPDRGNPLVDGPCGDPRISVLVSSILCPDGGLLPRSCARRPPRGGLHGARAVREGIFGEEIVPVPVKRRKEIVSVTTDDHIKPETSAEAWLELTMILWIR